MPERGGPGVVRAGALDCAGRTGGEASVDALLLDRVATKGADTSFWEQRAKTLAASGDSRGELAALQTLFLTQPQSEAAALALATRQEGTGDACGAADTWELLDSYRYDGTTPNQPRIRAINCPEHLPSGSVLLEEHRTADDWLWFGATVDGVAVERTGIDSIAPYALVGPRLAAQLQGPPGPVLAIKIGRDVRGGRLRLLDRVEIGGLVLRRLQAVEVTEVPGGLDLLLGRASARLVGLTFLGGGKVKLAPAPRGNRVPM